MSNGGGAYHLGLLWEPKWDVYGGPHPNQAPLTVNPVGAMRNRPVGDLCANWGLSVGQLRPTWRYWAPPLHPSQLGGTACRLLSRAAPNHLSWRDPSLRKWILFFRDKDGHSLVRYHSVDETGLFRRIPQNLSFFPGESQTINTKWLSGASLPGTFSHWSNALSFFSGLVR